MEKCSQSGAVIKTKEREKIAGGKENDFLPFSFSEKSAKLRKNTQVFVAKMVKSESRGESTFSKVSQLYLER